MPRKIVIVGGVAAGASLAARLRRLDEFAEIIMLEKDAHISFANCGMPYHIGGVIPERESLLVQTPEAMRTRFNIDVRVLSEVIAVDTANKRVRIKDANGEYDEGYDVLALCPGAAPISLYNGQASNIFSLRSMADADNIRAWVKSGGAKSAIVIGGGFVGLEMAENLKEYGLEVTLIEALKQILPPFDEEMTHEAKAALERHGINLALGSPVSAIEANEKAVNVTLASGQSYSADMAICAVGVRPSTAFLKDSGIDLGPKGHIITDEHMRTNIADVYAAGDAVQIKDFIMNTPTAVPLAGPANRQGRIAADNIAGLDHTYGGAQGTAVIKLFDITSAATGANERALKMAGIPYHTVYTHPFSHATYYPNAEQLSVKLLFGHDGRILGCQMAGKSGVDKRIDVVATAIRLKAHVTELAELELAYAPPYSSAKDPVNMLGYIAQNVLEGITDLARLEDMDDENIVLLDVRTKGEYEHGHIDGAINIPLDELRERLNELDPKKEIYEYCQVGVRAHTAHRILKQNGFKVKSLTGGYLSL